jgi:hypothetical protein
MHIDTLPHHYSLGCFYALLLLDRSNYQGTAYLPVTIPFGQENLQKYINASIRP